MSYPLASSLPADLRCFGRYSLLYRIGIGGMAQVYLARLTGTDGFQKLVVIKLIHQYFTERPEFVAMFIAEARLASRISHANVAQVLELGKVADTHFIAMEHVQGESVEELARRVPDLSLTYVARIVANAAAGLHAAHELRDQAGNPLEVVHRDVSPANILISYDGEVKVIDFGVARARDNLQTTDDGAVHGKFAHMAPEQAQGRDVDRRADVFALGIVLYEMTTRKPLFRAETEGETMANLLDAQVVPPTRQLVGYPPALEKVVLRALERDPAHRFQTAHDMQEALERFIVASGDLVLPAQVGQMMRRVFEDRIAEKKAMLGRCEQELDVPAEGESAPMSVGRPLRLLALLGALAVLAGVAVIVVLLTGPPPTVQVHQPGVPDAREISTATGPTAALDARAVPATITISIRVAPRRATLTLGGKRVSNPFETTRPAGTGEVEAVASAAGHVTERFKVSLARGSERVIELRRTRRPRPPRPPRPKKKGGKHGGVLDNPY